MSEWSGRGRKKGEGGGGEGEDLGVVERERVLVVLSEANQLSTCHSLITKPVTMMMVPRMKRGSKE